MWTSPVQLGSPRRISTFLQRVGRSGHTVRGTPKGRLFPLSRDELVESVALLRAVRSGMLDRIRIRDKPLDVLAQQIVAETASEDWAADELYELFRRAYPYRDLTRDRVRRRGGDARAGLHHPARAAAARWCTTTR